MKPTASPPYFPYGEHRTLAEVDAAPAECPKCGQARSTACSYRACPLSHQEAA